MVKGVLLLCARAKQLRSEPVGLPPVRVRGPGRTAAHAMDWMKGINTVPLYYGWFLHSGNSTDANLCMIHLLEIVIFHS